MDIRFSIEYTSRMEKALRDISTKDKKLFAEIVKRVGFFQNGEFDKLDIVPIKRKHGKYKISEIRIKSPGAYRIFYVTIDEINRKVVFIDGQQKKVNAFTSEYFKILDKALYDYLNT